LWGDLGDQAAEADRRFEYAITYDRDLVVGCRNEVDGARSRHGAISTNRLLVGRGVEERSRYTWG
jgi:hypothetical protein